MIPGFLNDNLFYQKRLVDLMGKNGSELGWRKSPERVSLAEADVDLWYAKVNASAVQVQALAENLTADEKRRAENFHFDRDKLRYMFSRGVLRLILSEYLNEPASQIQIVSGPQGKPALYQQEEEHSIHFNLSHSGEVVLYGVTKVGAVGVDVEKVREIADMENLIARFFSLQERKALNELSLIQRKQAFFNCWSRKEALIKAYGSGLSLPLDQFDVSVLPVQPIIHLNTHWDPLEARHWLLSDIQLDEQYAAAMAVNISSLDRPG